MRGVVTALGILACVAANANAQSGQMEVHGFADVGMMIFTASDSFDAVLGSANGVVFGGGAGVVLPQQIFVDVRASRFQKDGRRVVVADGDVFDLGIPDTVTISPVEITGGYQFGRSRDPLRPYAGGGISWYRYRESDAFSTETEAVSETFTGFHLLGGAEYRVLKYLALAGEVAWARVADALGQQSGSVGAAFDEHDLGGTTFRVKLVIGR